MTPLDRYRDIVSLATASQVEQACEWYTDAELIATDMIYIYARRGIAVTIENTASIISAFSPRQRWSRNVVQALEFAHGGKPVGLKNNLRMAELALTNGFAALRGLKTNAFARAIAGDYDAVTIDVWMISAAGLDAKKGVNKTQYRELADAVRTVAQELHMTPRVAQALIWICHRGGAA
jgi:hypothetical protein